MEIAILPMAVSALSSSTVSVSVIPQPNISPVVCGIRPISRAENEIYCYTTPNDRSHDGMCKIGMARSGRVGQRIREQTHTVDAKTELHWHASAKFEPDDKGIVRPFDDYKFHAYLERLGYERKPGTEWFAISSEEAWVRFNEFRLNHGVIKAPSAKQVTLILRPEQERCVEFLRSQIDEQLAADPDCIVRVLINAKARFGKTATVYAFILRVLLQMSGVFRNVLVLTNRPSVGESWRDDYCKFVAPESNMAFVSDCKSVSGKPGVVPSGEYDRIVSSGGADGRIAFVSLQDLKGAIDFGGKYDKLRWVAETKWDAVILDESHEGVETLKAEIALVRIDHKMEIYLSATPFKAIAEGKFPESAMFNWTYADEQAEKRRYEQLGIANQYTDMPKMELMSFMLSRIVLGRAMKGVGDVDGDGVDESYAFSLPEFFKVGKDGKFIHEEDVIRFIDTLATADGFPFASRESRRQFAHTFWLLDRVASAKALEQLLKKNRHFKGYKIVMVAGSDNASTSDDSINKMERSALARVRNAIKSGKNTITISVGRLTTGVTVPEWTAVLMLSGVRSPELYIQTAFRAGNPWSYVDAETGETVRKDSFAVFDFDPARQLTMIPSIAGGFYSGNSGEGGGTEDEVRRLLNYINVYGQADDETGEMMMLDAEQVLTLPTEYYSTRVVQRGFRDNSLVIGLGNVFRYGEGDREKMSDILGRVKSNDEAPIDVPSRETIGDIDENGDVSVDTKTIGTATDILGEKVYGELESPIEEMYGEAIGRANADADASGSEDLELEALRKIASSIADDTMEAAKNRPEASSLGDSRMRKVEAQVREKAGKIAEKALIDHRINESKANRDMDSEIDEVRQKAAERAVKVVADMEAGIEYDMGKTDPDGIPIHAGDAELVESLKDSGAYDDIAAAVNAEWDRTGKKPSRETIDTFGVSPVDSLDTSSVIAMLPEESIDASLTDDDRTVIGLIGDDRDKKVEESRQKMIDSGKGNGGIVDMAAREVVKEEREKKAEDAKRDSLVGIRGKIRDMMTPVPLFLLAYGDEDTNADNIWGLCPSAEDVRRYINIDADEAAWITDRFINKTVFNKAIVKFVDLKRRLGNLVSIDVRENGDIYMYINNPCNSMIYTPLQVILAQLRQQELDCPEMFDNQSFVFLDMYMKSGRYPAEEFKRLYASERMRELIPSDSDRMRHCLMQVCGFAPTRSMLDGALGYLLGWLPEGERAEFEGNFVLFDAEGASDEEIAEECRRLEIRARRRVYEDCVRLGIPYTGDMPWLDDESAADADADADDNDNDNDNDGEVDGEQAFCPSRSPSVGPMGVEAPSVPVDVADGGEEDSIRSGLFDSPSVNLFSGRYADGDGHDEPAVDDDETPYVPKHMRLA